MTKPKKLADRNPNLPEYAPRNWVRNLGLGL